MKKRILSVVFAVMMIICLVGCGITHQQATGQTESNSSGDFGNGYFTVITEWDSYQIVYANDTKVKYLIFDRGMYRYGITPLYNADGTLQIYEESEN